jgi:hypothetical protein
VNQQEKELVWLARKVEADEDLILRLELYMETHQRDWSKEVTRDFVQMLFNKRDQFHYEEHRLEKLAWQIAEDRENRGEMLSKDALVVFNQVTGR